MTTRTRPLPTALAVHEKRQIMHTSVIIVNYNGGHALSACLGSLYADPGCDEVEVILVDNGSRDGSARRAARQFPELKVLHSDENLGFGGANNLGAQHATGNILAFVNPDTVVEPGWLQALLHALECDPHAGLATSKILLFDTPCRVNTAGNDVHLSGLTLCRGLNRPAAQYEQPAEVAAVSGASFAIRRDLFWRLGGFDASYFMYFEDTDLSLRARLAGYHCRYVPDSIVRHDYRLRFGPHKTYYEERNRYMTLLKIFRWPTLLLLFPTLLLAEIVTWGFILLRDRRNWRNKLRAYGDLWRQRRAILAARRRVQETRRARDGALLEQTTHCLAFEQTGPGLIPCLAHLLFDPLFYLQRRLLLTLLSAGEATA